MSDIDGLDAFDNVMERLLSAHGDIERKAAQIYDLQSQVRTMADERDKALGQLRLAREDLATRPAAPPAPKSDDDIPF